MKAFKSSNQHRRIEPDKAYNAGFIKQELRLGFRMCTHRPLGNLNM